MKVQLDNIIELNKKICSDFFEELHNKKNLSIIDRYVSPTVVSHDPFPGQRPGAEGLKDTMRLFRSAFPDLHVIINDILAEGDKVMTKLTAKGTHRGEFMGIPGSNNEISYEEVIILRLSDEKIIEHWAVADSLSLLQQIGAVSISAS